MGIWVVVAIIAILLGGGLWWQHRASTNPSAPEVTTVATVNYLCRAGKTITATYHQGQPATSTSPTQPPTPTGSVDLSLSDGRTMTLPQTVSASGIRYANADGSFIFWSKGNGAFTMENNQETFQDCISLKPDTGNLPGTFASPSQGFSIRYPAGYTINESYTYQNLGPGKNIRGVKFTVPSTTAAGTNLNPETGLSVEEIPATTTCSASMFLYGAPAAQTVTDQGITYSVASSTGAAAGNRYEETVYALPGTNPCVAVRYFIHYGVIENYPSGSVKQFDEQSLLSQFDAIRRSLTVNQ